MQGTMSFRAPRHASAFEALRMPPEHPEAVDVAPASRYAPDSEMKTAESPMWSNKQRPPRPHAHEVSSGGSRLASSRLTSTNYWVSVEKIVITS